MASCKILLLPCKHYSRELTRQLVDLDRDWRDHGRGRVEVERCLRSWFATSGSKNRTLSRKTVETPLITPTGPSQVVPAAQRFRSDILYARKTLTASGLVVMARGRKSMSRDCPVALALLGLLFYSSLHGSLASSFQSQQAESCSRRVFWFMAITSRSTMEYWRYGAPRLPSGQPFLPATASA